MSEWCQNKDCCYKRNQNQMRGSKGNKYYQSNKSSSYYYDIGCCQGCFWQWFKQNEATLKNAVREIDKQIIGVDDAWEFRYESSYVDNGHSYNYFLINYLMGVRHPLTREQAQTPEQMQQDYGWYTRGNSEAKPLAIQLGLAS